MKKRTAILFTAACLAGRLPFNALAASNSNDCVRLVAQKEFTANEAFTPIEIMGRQFWLMLTGWLRSRSDPQPKATDTIQQFSWDTEVMVRDAARSYRNVNLFSAQEPPIVDGALLNEKINISTRVPFILKVNGAGTKTYFSGVKNINQKAYQEWKAKYPNFLGIYAGNEIDNDYVKHLRSTPDETSARLQRAKYPESAIAQIVKICKDAVQDKDQAVIGMRRLYFDSARRFFFDDPAKLIFLHSAWNVDHYPHEWGAGMVILETSSTGPYRHQDAMVSARGAARQYGKPWTWYMAVCYNGYREDGGQDNNAFPYCLTRAVASVTNDPPGDVRGPTSGVSPSLHRRDLFMGYLSGANFIYPETYPYTYWEYGSPDPKAWPRTFKLSPFGLALKEVMAFSQEHSDRGVSYAPVALLVPWNHAPFHWGGSSFSYFPMTRADTMIDAFQHTILPHYQDLKKGIEGSLYNSEFGDIYDMLRPGMPSGPISLSVLKNYPVSILLGSYEPNRAFAQRLMHYVKEGGTLIINTRQLTDQIPDSFIGARRTGRVRSLEGQVQTADGQTSLSLPEPYDYDQVELIGAVPLWLDQDGEILACVNDYGHGRVVLTTVDYMVPRKPLHNLGTKASIPNVLVDGKELPLIKLLMRQIVRETLPVEVQGDIQYGLNRVSDGWWIYLINNKGVTKFTRTPQKLDPAATTTVTISFKDLTVVSVRELLESRYLDRDKKQGTVSIDVGPGDIRILKITTMYH